MEPLTALLAIGGAHGVAVVVKALSGSGDLAALSSDVFRALTESESRIDARLGQIESQLDEVLEQPYAVALADGVRHFLDAGMTADDRQAELERARDRFITATSAARSELQRAVAERYILLCLLASRRVDLVAASLERLEAAATAAAVEAARIASIVETYEWKAAERELGRAAKSPDGPARERQAAIGTAAQESLELCGRLLAEVALLAPEVGLAPRAVPPQASGSRPSMPALRRQTGGQQVIYHVTAKPYWAFTALPGETLRIGSLSVTFARNEKSAELVAQVNLHAPLKRSISVVAAEPSTPDIDRLRASIPTFGAPPIPRPPVKAVVLSFPAFTAVEIGPDPGIVTIPLPNQPPAVIGIRIPPARSEVVTVTCLADHGGSP